MRLTLHHAEGPKPRNAARESCGLDDVDNALDVLVRDRRALVRRAADDDPVGLETTSELATPNQAARPSAGHPPSRSVRGGTERELHRTRANAASSSTDFSSRLQLEHVPLAAIVGGRLPSPLNSREGSAIVWTGSELIAWSDTVYERFNPTPADGALLTLPG